MAKDAEKKSNNEKRHFFKDFKAELKKVIWPTPKQVVNNTIAVITIVLITAVIVFALDLIFKSINTYGIDNIRNIVKSENNEVVDDSESKEENEEEQSSEENTDETTAVEQNEENSAEEQ